MKLRRCLKRAIQRTRQWLDEPEPAPKTHTLSAPVAFDNSYPWINAYIDIDGHEAFVEPDSGLDLSKARWQAGSQ